jgi:hypothetical protein
MSTPPRSRRRPARPLLRGLGLVVAGLSLLLPSCSSGASSPLATLQNARRPLPAGPVPSGIARMVCSPKAHQEIAQTLGLRASVSAPTWINHAYSCRYRYPDGGFVLTVKELSSWPQTLAYYAGLGRQQGKTATVRNLGQGAFQTDNGSAVVRKDWKILTVDISGLPAQFGRPPTSRGDVAVTVADLILACWAGD